MTAVITTINITNDQMFSSVFDLQVNLRLDRLADQGEPIDSIVKSHWTAAI